MLLDGPAVLGWERWREVGERYGMGLVATLLTELMDAGAIARQPVEPLAHVLIGALDEAALYVARAADPDAARAEVRTVLHRLVAVVAGPIAGDRDADPPSALVGRLRRPDLPRPDPQLGLDLVDLPLDVVESLEDGGELVLDVDGGHGPSSARSGPSR